MSHFSESDSIFFSDGYRLAEALCGEDISPESLFRLMESLYEQVDMLIGSFIHRCRREGKPVDCRKGCSWCCHQPVMASTYEMIFLGDYLRKHMDEPAREKILRRAEARKKAIMDMDLKGMFRYKSPCPLLEKNACRIYAGRPMACRIYLSSDVGSCIREYHEPGEKYIFPTLYAFPLQAGKMMNEGVSSWFREKGMVISEWTLDSNLSESIKNPGLFDTWKTGGTILLQPPSGKTDVLFLRELGFL